MRLLRSVLLVLALALPSAAPAVQERLVLAVEEGSCTLRLEADDEARGLRLRVSPETSTCRVSLETVQRLLGEAFSRTDPPRLEGTYRSLYLGRLVDFPWLSEHVASAASKDPRWDPRKGRPVAMDVNAYVADLLSRREVTGPLEEPLRKSGYRIASASVEKVLVARARELPGHEGAAGRLPFDAMVWLQLERS